MHMCTETRDMGIVRYHPTPHPLSQALLLTLQLSVLAGPASCFCLSRLHFSKSCHGCWGFKLWSSWCVPNVHPTQCISPAPSSDVSKNKDCSLGYLCSQPIQNLWGGLKICRHGWGPSISQPSTLPATTSTFFAYLPRLSSESGLWLQGRTTQPYALSSKNLWVSI